MLHVPSRSPPLTSCLPTRRPNRSSTLSERSSLTSRVPFSSEESRPSGSGAEITLTESTVAPAGSTALVVSLV